MEKLMLRKEKIVLINENYPCTYAHVLSLNQDAGCVQSYDWRLVACI